MEQGESRCRAARTNILCCEPLYSALAPYILCLAYVINKVMPVSNHFTMDWILRALE